MFLDRENNKKQIQKAYRRELKEEVDQKRSKMISNKSQQYQPQKQTFSLIANIQKQQDERKKKSEQYYIQLRMQIEEQKRIKNQKQAQIKQRQLQEENKIKQEQQKLKERYEEQRLRQQKGGKNVNTKVGNDQKSPTIPEVYKKKKLAPIASQQKYQINKNFNQSSTDEFNRLKIYSNQKLQQSNQIKSSINYNNQNNHQFQPTLYPNRIQNQPYNYVTRKVYKDSYYKELLGERKRLQQQTNQISNLNRIFNSQRTKRKQQSRGLQELRNLQKLLEDKSSSYMDFNLNENLKESRYKSISKLTNLLSLSSKKNKDQYRKLD